MDSNPSGASADPAAGRPAGAVDPAAAPNPAETRAATDRTLADYGREWLEYFTYGLQVRGDLLKAHARNLAFGIALGAVAGAVVLTLAILGCVHLARGIVNGLSAAFPGQPWLGQLIGGLLLLGGGIGGLFLGIARLKNQSLAKTVQKYEQRKLHQRAAFGRDVREQAAAAAQK